ncbi:hypothetical protein BKI52_26475 [marine bacterium AO1-C]|nr:hypothetical protein BKI52_26475 [marine bacterium AO1-C]
MHNNYHFLKHLSKEIAQRLHTSWSMGMDATLEVKEGMQLAEAFSQNKDELVLGFCSAHQDFYIKAVLRPDFACLSFPAEFFRAKRNSVDLFKALQGKKVIQVVQHLNERAFTLLFEGNAALLFKMHGGRSNIISFENEQFVISFHKKMEKDQALTLVGMDRPITQNLTYFEETEGNIRTLYPTFGKNVLKYLEQLGISNTNNFSQQWHIIQDAVQKMEQAGFYIYLQQGLPELFTFPLALGELLHHYPSAIEAANNFYYEYVKITSLAREKDRAKKQLNKRLKQTRNYLNKTYGKLAELDDSNQNEETANIIMANLHIIQPRAKSVELFDFYHDTQRTIKLKEDLSPQKNAEIYYRKAKNAKIEIQKLEENIDRREKEKKELEQHLAIVLEIDNLKELKKYLKNNQLSTKQQQASLDKFPFKRFDYQGFEIWIGKNSKNNDLLTQKYAYKEDLWLHAKDVTGSHVVVKYQAGKTFPNDVVEKAASLAAYYSKRSNDSLCPVIVTPKKFVRKTKDLADGQVIVDKEEVIMVVPEKF